MAFLATNALVHDRYRVLRIIGRGGMGAVYETLDTRLEIRVALKQMTIQGTDVEQAFRREAHLLSGLRHPGLPRVIDYFDEHSDRFLVMDYIEGQDLLELVREHAALLDPSTVLAWTEQILDVLVYLHERTPPILHRDLKPANLKLTDGDRIVVLDFGLAKGALAFAAAGPHTTPSLFAASPQYAPLEQLRGSGTTDRSDLYSLGATMFHLLTGAAPPSALDRSAAIVEGQRDPMIDWDERSPLDAGVRTIVRTAMRLNASDRYAGAAEMRDAVARITSRNADRRRLVRAGVQPVPPSLDATIPLAGKELLTPLVPVAWQSGRPTAVIGAGLVLLLALFWTARSMTRLATEGGAGEGAAAPTQEFVTALDALIGPGRPEAGAGSIAVAGATQAYVFDLAPEDRVFIRTIAYDSGLGGLRMQFLDPDRREIIGTCLACGDLGVQAIAARGRHRLVVGGNDAAIGSYRLGINRVPLPQPCVVERAPGAVAAAADTVDAPPEALGPGCGVIAVPGDSDVYAVSLRAGETLRVSSPSHDPDLAGLDFTLQDDVGAVVSSASLETTPLATAVNRDGTWRLRVGSERHPGTGRYSLQFVIGRP